MIICFYGIFLLKINSNKNRKRAIKMEQLKKVTIGNRYEVQPKNFQRAFIGEAKEVSDEGILFEILSCETCDRNLVSEENPYVRVNSMDVKKEIGSDIFFS